MLITRPEPGARQTALRVAALGLTPIMAAALVVEPLPGRLPPAAGIAAVVAASGNVLDACLPGFRDTILLTVGDATAARARALGFTRVTSADGDAAALAALAARLLRPADGPLLLPCGRGQGAVLASMLRQAGFRVNRRVVYAARPVRTLPPAAAAALRSGEVRAALFFSAETARAFVRMIQRAGLSGALGGVDALAIGGAAGVALQALPWRHVGVAAKPTQDAMLALLP